MNRFLLGSLLVGAVLGCGDSKPLSKSNRKITTEEYRKMSPAERDDPYVQDNLEKPPSRRR